MSLVTVSDKRNRVYQRSFDHELAQELRASGESYAAIGRKLGASPEGVRRVCDPAVRQKMSESALDTARSKRTPCKGGCGRLVWMNAPERTGYCRACLTLKLIEADIRPDALRCTGCREWKADEQFGIDRRKGTARRGHRSECRQCETARRRDHRRRNPAQTHEYDRNRKRQQRNIQGVPMYRYIVLRESSETGWQEIGRCEASTPIQAVERTAEGSGSFVAVAESHIVDVKPVTVLKATSRKVRSAA